MSFFTTGEAAREIHRLSHLCENNNNIEPELYEKYDVKRGLREKTVRVSSLVLRKSQQ